MHRHHQRTLQALFAHPLEHGIRADDVESLLRELGAVVTPLDRQRLAIRLPGGQDSWIHASSGPHRPVLDGDTVLRLRHLLQEAGITPDHPQPAATGPRGDQASRLVVHLNRHHSDLWRLEGDNVEHAQLEPHGLWGTGQRLVHRHDRDIAGQRAPLDHAYLNAITEALEGAEAVLLLGHGTGESSMAHLLLQHLQTHRPDLLPRIVATVSLDDGGLSPQGLLAIARQHFGNLPHRHPLVVPGQAVVEPGGNPGPLSG